MKSWIIYTFHDRYGIKYLVFNNGGRSDRRLKNGVKKWTQWSNWRTASEAPNQPKANFTSSFNQPNEEKWLSESSQRSWKTACGGYAAQLLNKHFSSSFSLFFLYLIKSTIPFLCSSLPATYLFSLKKEVCYTMQEIKQVECLCEFIDLVSFNWIMKGSWRRWNGIQPGENS